jgi:hypothetical protein
MKNLGPKIYIGLKVINEDLCGGITLRLTKLNTQNIPIVNMANLRAEQWNKQ